MERKKNKPVEQIAKETAEYPDSDIEEITDDLIPDSVPEPTVKDKPKKTRPPKSTAQIESATRVFKEANESRSAAAKQKKEDKELALKLVEARRLLEKHADVPPPDPPKRRGRPKKEKSPEPSESESSSDESASEPEETPKLEKTRKTTKTVRIQETDSDSDGAKAPPRRRSNNLGRRSYPEIKPLFL